MRVRESHRQGVLAPSFTLPYPPNAVRMCIASPAVLSVNDLVGILSAVTTTSEANSSSWDTPTILGLVVGGLGLIFALVSLAWQGERWLSRRRNRAARALLATAMERGQELLREVQSGEPSRDFGDVKQRIGAWEEEVASNVRSYAPELVPFLRDSSGMTFYQSQYADRDRLANFLRARLTRLGEIIGRLGS